MLFRSAGRLRRQGLSGRTVTLKVRLHDFTTLSRSTTLASPTDDAATIARSARALLNDLVDQQVTDGGVRLLGVGVSGLADWVQEDLFEALFDQPGADADTGSPTGSTPEESQQESLQESQEEPSTPAEEVVVPDRGRPTWAPGMDVEHDEHGRGWVWGSGRGVVTVRFETADSPAGPVRSFRGDDPALRPWVTPAPKSEDPRSEEHTSELQSH